jgi:hypothetical protein
MESGRTEVLVDLVAGKLDPREAGVVQSHAAECADCRGWIAAQAAVWAALEADAAPAVSPTFDSRLYRKIAELETEAWWKRAWSGFSDELWPSFARPAAAVSLALTLIVAVVLTRAPQPEASPEPSAAFVSADVEAVEETLSDFEMLQALGELPRAL